MSRLKKLCKVLQDTVVGNCDAVPDGWFKCTDLAKESNVSIPTVLRKLRKLIAAGKIETAKFRVMTGRGPYPIVHYRYAKHKKATS